MAANAGSSAKKTIRVLWCDPGIPALKGRRGLFCEILIVAILCLSTVISVSVTAQGFPCDGSFYYVATDKNSESRFYRLVMHESDQTFEYEEIPLKLDHKRHITCLGYNVKDRKIYGLDFNSYELLQIDVDGTLTSLGVPENLDTTFEYYAGDMTADGRRLYVVARNPKTGIDERAYSIQVNDPPRYYAGYFPVISDVPVALSDFTVDPLVGVTYGFDYISGQIVETNRNGSTTVNHSPFPIDKVKEGFGSLFFDRFGQLYGLGSPGRPGGEQNTMYRINKSRGGSEKIKNTVGGVDTDGCGCPFTIEFSKSISPTELVECQEVVIDYTIQNNAGIGQVSTRVEDILPDVLTIKEVQIENPFTVKIKSGVGTNHLDIDEWTLVLGDNRLRVIADLGRVEPNIYKSQAQLKNLPLAFNTRVLSDDPTTGMSVDPTEFTVIDKNDIKIMDHTWTSCNRDTMFLTVPLKGDFVWNNGSTAQVLPVLQDGLFGVTIQSPCFTFTDSIYVELDTEPLFIDLGPDLNVQLGELVQLGFISNVQNIPSIRWSTVNNTSLECKECPVTSFIATANTTASLTITSDRGCTATDDIQIHVDETKRIFVPNVFSPNNDGINDFLSVYGNTGMITSFKIYDRWGNLVGHFNDLPLNDAKTGWDGNSRGDQLPIGTYIWQAEIRFVDQVTQQFVGSTTLIR